MIDNAAVLAGALAEKGHRIVTGGTDTHLFLMSFIDIPKLTGKKVEKALDAAGITVNKNTVPFDPEKPFVTSGIRVGTPAITTRGMGIEEMKQIADFIDRGIKNRLKEDVLAEIATEVAVFCKKFPLY